MCLGAQKAIADAGKAGRHLHHLGRRREGHAERDHEARARNYAATGLNSSDQIGRAGFNRAMAILAGAVAEKETVLPSPIITIDNAVKFYDENSKF